MRWRAIRREAWLGLAICVCLCSTPRGHTAMEPIAQTIQSISEMALRESASMQGGRVTPQWLEDGNRFLFAHDGPQDLGVFLADPQAARITRLTDEAALREALSKVAGTESSRLKARYVGLTADSNTLFLEVGEHILAVDVRTSSVRAAPERESAIAKRQPRLISRQFPTTFGDLVEARSPDGRRFITVRDANLFVRSAGDDSLRALTTDGTERLTWLNTQESAQSFNVYWSADSRHIAAVQLDTRDVWHEPLAHWLGARPETDYVPYPRAGEPMHRFRLAVLDVDTGSRVSVDIGDTTDRYVDILGWRSDGRAVYYQTIDREQKDLRVFAADATTGKSVQILHESRSTYIDTPMTLGIRFFFPLQRSTGFVHLSERDGWRHIYLYDERGELVRRLTQGAWPVSEVVAIDERQGWVYFRASRDESAPYDLQLFRVPLRGGALRQLTSGPGTHTIAMSPSLRYFVAERSAPDVPPEVQLRAADGRLVAPLSRARVTQLVADGFAGIEPFVARSADGRWDMHGIIVKPHRFAAAQRYPMVEIIYGGMQSINTPHGYYLQGEAGSLILRSLVNAGFGVVIVDAPGTPGRGKAFQDATYGIWPQTVIGNHVRWIEAAARTRPWMDLGRVGIFGHSWGGYMAQRAMIDAPLFYKVAVEHAGPADFIDHPTYIEPFMGLPQHNPAGYAAASNLTRVDAIRGPVLVMTMPLDVNSAFTPGMKFLDAMQRAKRDVDLVIFPDSNHRMNCCGLDRQMYAVALVQRYFRAHLQPDAVAPAARAGNP